MKRLGKIAILGALVGTLSGCSTYKVPTTKIPLAGEVSFWGHPTRYLVDNNNDGKVDFIYKVKNYDDGKSDFINKLAGGVPDEVLWISQPYIPEGRVMQEPEEYGGYKITPETRIMTPEIQELADSILNLEKRLIAKTDSVFSRKRER